MGARLEYNGKFAVEGRRVRLLALVTDGIGASGGIARYNTDLFKAMSNSAHVEQVIVLPRFGNDNTSRPEKVVQLEALSNAYHWAVKAAYLVLRGGFDAIFCGHLNAAPFVARLARLGRTPLWIQTHGIEAWEDRGPKFRRALASARLVTAVSRHTRRRLLSWSDVVPSRVRVLPNTFDPTYAPSPRRMDLAARYGLKNNKVILTVGRMSSSERYKGHDRIIRCLEALRSVVPEVVYLIVGTGDDQQRLEALAQNLGVRGAIIFAGFVPAAEIADHYALADVFAMPSTGEGFGIVFLEAAAAGLPVIGGSSDGSLDALAEGAVGTPVDVEDFNALTNALAKALSNGRPGARESFQRFASSYFSCYVNELVQVVRS